MAISEIDSESAGGSATSDLAFTHNMTIAEDDVLVAFIHHGAAATTQVDNNGATPFTSPYDALTPGNSRGYVWTRVAGASEPDHYHWTFSTTPGWSIVMRQFRGVDTASIWDVTPAAATDGTGTSATATAPDITVTAGAMGLLAIFVDSSSATVSSPTNSYGTEVENTTRALATYIRAGLSAGAVGSAEATVSVSDDWLALHCALKVGGAVPTVTTTAISDITASAASSGGTITSDGGATITARGVCWNTTGTPTISDSKTID